MPDLDTLDMADADLDDDEGPTGLDRIAADRIADELDDIAWCRRGGWPAGGA